MPLLLLNQIQQNLFFFNLAVSKSLIPLIHPKMASSNTAEQTDTKDKNTQPQPEKNASLLPAKLEEDDEFEDFPAEGVLCHNAIYNIWY